MKKNLIFATLLGLLSASTAFAVTTIEGSTTIGGGTFTPSSKVGIKIISTATSYAATSAHVSGTYQYGTVGGSGVTGDPSKILKKAIPTQSGTIGAPEDPASATGLTGTWE
ncbi:MAG: hypothetical protein WCK54_16845 [Desulfuromonadales bacterium]